jgi:hypothetical protein
MIEFFNGWMIMGIQQFLENFKTLVGYFQTLFPANFLKILKPLFNTHLLSLKLLITPR